ncbi:meiosis 1 arrest protein-like [Clavelina lepadiformis]|uniref:meiosis 1 arrest protein-like n=1 Tax=Clavelina lepadiformis TaxID=159417 RepID=UPI004042E1D8
MAFKERTNTQTPDNIRYPYSRQPAHLMILDLTSRFSKEVTEAVCDGISNFFGLTCSMKSGLYRIPFCGLLAMTPYVEVLFSIQRLNRASYSRIDLALSELRKLISESCAKWSVKPDVQPIEHAIRDAATQFQKIKQVAGTLTKLELTIVTCHSSQEIRRAATLALSKVNVKDIRHVNVLSFATTLESVGSSETVTVDAGVSSNDLKEGCCMDLAGILDVTVIDSNSLTFESYMRNWLSDRGTDQEHLHLCFNMRGHENGLIIKCDVKERLINPSELPYNNNFEIVVDGSSDGWVQNSMTTKTGVKPANASAVTKLRVVKRVPCQNVCESILFGIPLLLYSSSCWRMDWDALESNQNRFIALCRSLMEKSECLICKNTTPYCRKQGGPFVTTPHGLYVVMASENLGSLLIKSIASMELLISSQVPLQPKWETISDEAVREIDGALQNVETTSTFNPLSIDAGWIPVLKDNLLDLGTKRGTNSERKPLQKANSSNIVGSKRSASLQNSRPNTGKATRFAAPRQELQQCTGPVNRTPNTPVISLAVKPASKKTVSFPQFH